MSPLLIIGAGNMGGAFYRGLQDVLDDDRLLLCDPDEEKMRQLHARRFTTDADTLLPEAGIVLFAVKPQSFEDCIQEIKTPLEDKLILSIMAGVPIARLREKTGSERIVRAMPNLAATVGESVTGWIPSPACTEEDRQSAVGIFEAVGTTIELDEEAKIDAITPLSGSGPAYYFLLTEMLQKQAEQWGFTPDQAQTLAEQTLIGSAQLLIRNDKSPEEWRKGVTSKGGVTEAMLKHLKESGMEEVFFAALEKARKRSEELGR